MATSLAGLSACWHPHVDGLVQERRNSSALAAELRLSCTKPMMWSLACVIAGAFGPASVLYDQMEIKHIQHDALG